MPNNAKIQISSSNCQLFTNQSADSDYFLLDPLLIINLGGLYLDLIENLQSHIIVEVRRAEQWHYPVSCYKVEAAEDT
jgi:hypothetical protein